MTLRLDGRLYDGHSSRPHRVAVEMDEGGHVVVQGDGFSLRYPPEHVRIAARMGNTPRSLTFVDGAKCETRDNDTADEMERRLGGGDGIARLAYRLESKYKTALLALAGLVAIVTVGAVWGIPWGAEVVAMRLPDEVAQSIGAGTLETLDRTIFKPSSVPESTQGRMRAAFADLAAHYPQLPLHLEFRALGLPNAFALPDGTVVVTDALVELADHDGQVMAVLAHEIGHVHHRHGLRKALEASSVALLISAYLGDVGNVSAIMAALPTVYAQAAYSRDHETEADGFALELMAEVGQDPRDFAAIMRKLQTALGEGAEDDAWRYIASHPPTSDRIARFEAAADSAARGGGARP